VVEPEIALEEQYDVLVAAARWPALTRAFVDDVHAGGRAILGVFDREEGSARARLAGIGVDAVIESDCGARAFVDAIRGLHARRVVVGAPAPATDADAEARVRRGRVIAVGGAPGVGRTEVAIQLAVRLGAALIDADDVAPAVAPRLGLPIEPNIRTAIDAVEHGDGDPAATLVHAGGSTVLAGLPSAGAWSHVRAGEVVRVVHHVARGADAVVVDGLGSLEDIGSVPRSRHAVARALAVEADVIVGVASATPLGVARFLSWAVELRAVAPEAALVVAVNRAPASRFRRGELFEELTRSLPAVGVAFVSEDRKVVQAAWDGTFVRAGAFTRGVGALAEVVEQARASRRDERDAFGIAS
jgi:hypothetical protein